MVWMAGCLLVEIPLSSGEDVFNFVSRILSRYEARGGEKEREREREREKERKRERERRREGERDTTQRPSKTIG